MGAPVAPRLRGDEAPLQAVRAALAGPGLCTLSAEPGGGRTSLAAFYAREQAQAGREVWWLDGLGASPGSLLLRLWTMSGAGDPLPTDPVGELARRLPPQQPPLLLIVEDPDPTVDVGDWARGTWSLLWLGASSRATVHLSALSPRRAEMLFPEALSGRAIGLAGPCTPRLATLLGQLHLEDRPQEPDLGDCVARVVARLRSELWLALHALAALGQAPASLWPGWVVEGLLATLLVELRGDDLRVPPSVLGALELQVWRARVGLDLLRLVDQPWERVRAPFLRFSFLGFEGAAEALAALRVFELELYLERDDAAALFAAGEAFAARALPAPALPQAPPPPLPWPAEPGEEDGIRAAPAVWLGRALADRALALRHRPSGQPLPERELRARTPRLTDWRERSGLLAPSPFRRILRRFTAVVGWVIRWQVEKVEGYDEALVTLAYEVDDTLYFHEFVVELQVPPQPPRHPEERAWVASLLQLGRPVTLLIAPDDPARGWVYGRMGVYLFAPESNALRFAAR